MTLGYHQCLTYDLHSGEFVFGCIWVGVGMGEEGPAFLAVINILCSKYLCTQNDVPAKVESIFFVNMKEKTLSFENFFFTFESIIFFSFIVKSGLVLKFNISYIWIVGIVSGQVLIAIVVFRISKGINPSLKLI